MDTIGDFITILRNASHSGLPKCNAQWSKIRESIAQILLDRGFISSYKVKENEQKHKLLEVSLKYMYTSGSKKTPALVGIKRESRPGCRVYYSCDAIPKVLGGLGVAILTTSKGILPDKEARRQKTGGELLCTVW